MIPKRIQRKRTKGWRMPEAAVYVGRPSRWGNPYTVGETYMWLGATELGYPIATYREPRTYDFQIRVERLTDPAVAVEWFRAWYGSTMAARPYYGTTALRGHDLACWCPLEDANGNRVPCHADVLLDLANR